ncbi:MAG: hypothetical protein ABIC40_08660, partial [bacterium]
ILVWILVLISPAYPAAKQDTKEDELRPPDYVNSEYGFGLALPEGYITFDYKDDKTNIIEILGQPDDPKANISIEPLPEDVTDVAGFWQFLKNRDPLMESGISYEMVTSVADTGAILARIEKIDHEKYILAITWVFVHDGFGFTLSGYPPPSGKFNMARDFGYEIKSQFRWMTPEEIEKYESEKDAENPPPD